MRAKDLIAITVGLCLPGAVSVCSPAAAQSYPSKPIRLIVPGTPGGGSDTPARILAQSVGDDLGWRLVIDNRVGASGRIGTELVANARSDGYTLLLASATPNAVVPSAVKDLPYDAIRDFTPVSLLSTSDFILSIHPSVPARSVAELIAVAKAKPGQMNFSSVGNISGAHVTGELFKQLAHINIVHVPYNGPGPAITALLAGEVSIYFASGPSVTPHAKTGKLRLLATTGPKRSRLFPDLPTTSETVPGHVANLWYGVMAPAKTPKDIITKLNTAIIAAGKTPKVVEQFTNVAMESVNNSPEEFAAFLKAEIAKWVKVVKASGTPIQ